MRFLEHIIIKAVENNSNIKLSRTLTDFETYRMISDAYDFEDVLETSMNFTMERVAMKNKITKKKVETEFRKSMEHIALKAWMRTLKENNQLLFKYFMEEYYDNKSNIMRKYIKEYYVQCNPLIRINWETSKNGYNFWRLRNETLSKIMIDMFKHEIK